MGRDGATTRRYAPTEERVTTGEPIERRPVFRMTHRTWQGWTAGNPPDLYQIIEDCSRQIRHRMQDPDPLDRADAQTILEYLKWIRRAARKLLAQAERAKASNAAFRAHRTIRNAHLGMTRAKMPRREVQPLSDMLGRGRKLLEAMEEASDRPF